MNNLNGVGNNHKIHDYVTYKNNGIYQIIDICNIEFDGSDEKMYYIMKSEYENNTVVYVPVDSKDLVEQILPILTTDEIDEIIEKTETTKLQWISDTKARSARFEQMLAEGDKTKILCLIRMISAQKINLEGQKKKLSASDSRILAKAEKIIKEEFAFSLDIDVCDVTSYIIEHKKTKKEA